MYVGRDQLAQLFLVVNVQNFVGVCFIVKLVSNSFFCHFVHVLVAVQLVFDFDEVLGVLEGGHRFQPLVRKVSHDHWVFVRGSLMAQQKYIQVVSYLVLSELLGPHPVFPSNNDAANWFCRQVQSADGVAGLEIFEV